MSKDYLSRKAQITLISCLLASLVFIALPFLSFILGPAIYKLYPQSVKDRHMKGAVEAIAELAPFPTTAREFKISTRGNFIARTYSGSFTDEPANIRKWLAASPGYPTSSVGKDMTAELQCVDAAADRGWLKTSQGCSKVEFGISVN